jgi:F420-0:gamma-glutamyl ligase
VCSQRGDDSLLSVLRQLVRRLALGGGDEIRERDVQSYAHEVVERREGRVASSVLDLAESPPTRTPARSASAVCVIPRASRSCFTCRPTIASSGRQSGISRAGPGGSRSGARGRRPPPSFARAAGPDGQASRRRLAGAHRSRR